MKSKSSYQYVAISASVFCFGVIYGLLLSLAPVALINHRQLTHFLFEEEWAKFCFYVLSALVGGLSAIMIFNRCRISNANTSAQALGNWRQSLAFLKAHGFEIFATAVVFLFTACACLCQKLNIAGLPETSSLGTAWPNLGLVLIVFAMSCQFVVNGTEGHGLSASDWHFTLTKPISLAWIILLAGISLLFSTWFPLLALPGIFIGMKWRLVSKMEEQSTLSKSACEVDQSSA
jgi:hypothetical protein